MRTHIRLIALLLALVLGASVLASCGGDDDTDASTSDSSDSSDSSSAGDDAGTDGGDGSGPAGAVPLDGAVAFWFQTPVHVGPDGTVTRLGPTGAQFTPTVLARGADAVYAVMGEQDADDTTRSTDTLVRIDAATGELTRVVVLQEVAQGEQRDSFRAVLPLDGAVGVVRSPADGGKVIETYDAVSGELRATVPADQYGTIVTDGVAYFSPIYGGLARIDPLTGERTDEIAEGTPFRDVAPDVDILAATLTADGSALSADNAEDLERVVDPVEIEGDTVVMTPEHIWWVSTVFGISFEDGTSALHEALAGYDRASGRITTYAPTGELGARYLPEDADFDVATLSQAQLVVRDGAVFVDDSQVQPDFENGRILRLDTATGTFEVLYTPNLAGADYHRLELLDTSADGVWVAVTRYTITEVGEDGSESSTFETTVVQLDPATGAELTAAIIG